MPPVLAMCSRGEFCSSDVCLRPFQAVLRAADSDRRVAVDPAVGTTTHPREPPAEDASADGTEDTTLEDLSLEDTTLEEDPGTPEDAVPGESGPGRSGAAPRRRLNATAASPAAPEESAIVATCWRRRPPLVQLS